MEHLVAFDLIQRPVEPVPDLPGQLKPDRQVIQIFPGHQGLFIGIFPKFQIKLFQFFI